MKQSHTVQARGNPSSLSIKTNRSSGATEHNFTSIILAPHTLAPCALHKHLAFPTNKHHEIPRRDQGKGNTHREQRTRIWVTFLSYLQQTTQSRVGGEQGRLPPRPGGRPAAHTRPRTPRCIHQSLVHLRRRKSPPAAPAAPRRSGKL